MAKKLIWIVVAVLVVGGLWYWYTTRTEADTLSSGGVSSHDTLGSGSKASMDSGAVTGSDIDGKDSSSAGYGGTVSYPDTPPVAKTVTPAPAYTGTVSSGSASPQAVSQAPVAMPGPVAPATTNTTPSSLPVSDTLSPSSPNGMAFGGSGKFQWYRQGNLTWRINTQSGATCIAFATMDEWQKPIVYSHGCGNA